MVQASAASVSARESVIVVMDANKSKGNMDALDWALKHVVRRRDTVIVLGVSSDFGKKNSCFPLNMGERLEFSSQGQGEARPKELGEEIERKKEQYQNNLQPFYRQCKKNEVNMEVKLAFGFCPEKITVEQAQNSNPRWIVLDSYLKKHKVVIYAHVGCNIAVMKGKDVATLTPSRTLPGSPTQTDNPLTTKNQQPGGENQVNVSSSQEGQSSSAQPRSPCWYPLSWRSGFPRAFSQTELQEVTNCFSEENLIQDQDNIKVYEGVVQESPVLVRSFSEDDERFWTMLKILSRVRHRNISNLVGYCCTGTSLFLLSDYPCLGTLEVNLRIDDSARNLPWKARWYIAMEIGGSLRYLHEECIDGGAIVHLSVCSSHVVFTNGCSTMLTNFETARWIKDGCTRNEDSQAVCASLQEEEICSIDVHDYGMFLIELISGKSAHFYHIESRGQSLINWALPLLKHGLISEVLDARLEDSNDVRAAHHMAKAALLCLKNDTDHRISMSQVLAVVRGDQLAMAKC
ncbi:serine/threonine-protein kinase CDG1 [Ricinus communis]|uniref:serine/threonine-protein kinase CDG1 n=1 Tax=Ricinus communis TaxID=3988 RepID=UPI00201AEFA5|nr:serine/threonine-protein kinase CDG1 [Ricinus communis]